MVYAEPMNPSPRGRAPWWIVVAVVLVSVCAAVAFLSWRSGATAASRHTLRIGDQVTVSIDVPGSVAVLVEALSPDGSSAALGYAMLGHGGGAAGIQDRVPAGKRLRLVVGLGADIVGREAGGGAEAVLARSTLRGATAGNYFEGTLSLKNADATAEFVLQDRSASLLIRMIDGRLQIIPAGK
jgi:hypothetical protein